MAEQPATEEVSYRASMDFLKAMEQAGLVELNGEETFRPIQTKSRDEAATRILNVHAIMAAQGYSEDAVHKLFMEFTAFITNPANRNPEADGTLYA